MAQGYLFYTLGYNPLLLYVVAQLVELSLCELFWSAAMAL